MKRFIYIMCSIVLGLVISCGLEEDIIEQKDIIGEELVIKSVKYPLELIKGKESFFELEVVFPNNCYSFRSYTYRVNGLERIFGVIATEYLTIDCENTEVIKKINMKFTPLKSSNYILKFYMGLDKERKKKYIIKEMIVK